MPRDVDPVQLPVQGGQRRQRPGISTGEPRRLGRLHSLEQREPPSGLDDGGTSLHVGDHGNRRPRLPLRQTSQGLLVEMSHLLALDPLLLVAINSLLLDRHRWHGIERGPGHDAVLVQNPHRQAPRSAVTVFGHRRHDRAVITSREIDGVHLQLQKAHVPRRPDPFAHQREQGLRHRAPLLVRKRHRQPHLVVGPARDAEDQGRRTTADHRRERAWVWRRARDERNSALQVALHRSEPLGPGRRRDRR